MEEIISKNTSALVGIQCIELSIKEADEVIKDFLKRNRDLFDFSNSPSWKFPHINIEKLDVLTVMNTYRFRSASEEKQYLELMEVFIDRLYFSLLAIYQFLTSSDTSSQDPMGQGDCQQSPVKMPWENSSRDQGPFYMVNPTGLLKQIHAKLLSMDIAPKILRNGGSKLDRVLAKKGTHEILKVHSRSQTEQLGLEGCDSCYLAQNLLKFLADTVSHCVKVLSGQESEIAKLRQDLKDTVWIYSQRAVVVKWCEAIKSDSTNMIETVKDLLKQNSTCKDELTSAHSKWDEEAAKTQSLMDETNKKLISLKDELADERKGRRKVTKQRDSSVTKLNEVESQLGIMTETSKSHELEKMGLKQAMEDLTGAHTKLESTQSDCLTQLNEANKGRETAIEEKNELSQKLSALESQMDVKDEEIQKLKNLLTKFHNYEKEKLELKKTLASMKHKLENGRKAEIAFETERQVHKEETEGLKDSLENANSQIELLILYPDLNGPINPPTRETGDPLQAMEMQLKSNNLRMDILKSQTERLNVTLNKLRSHIKSK